MFEKEQQCMKIHQTIIAMGSPGQCSLISKTLKFDFFDLLCTHDINSTFILRKAVENGFKWTG